MAEIKLKKVKIKTNHKCLICFDTGEYFNGEEYVKCTHEKPNNLGLTQDEKINDYLENEEEEEL
jgi:hypothetical protein